MDESLNEHAIVELSPIEARVVGSLIEKAFLTPDVYPMTTNALVSACNQKTNRDPVSAYEAVEVDACLLELRQRNLVRRVHTPGARSTKHRHTLDEILAINEAELAILSVLLLRGPQTVGELRLRTERHDVLDDLESTEACLEGLTDHPRPLAVQLARQPGQKEARWQHLLSTDGDGTSTAEIAAPAEPKASAPEPASPPRRPAAPSATPPAAEGLDVADRLAKLESEVETLRRQLHRLASQLGEDLA